MPTSHFKAQILIITLLVLTVISIIVIGLVGLANRDVQQTVANKEYQRLYSAAEDSILQLIDDFGPGERNLAEVIQQKYPGACSLVVASEYTCTFSNNTVITKMSIKDTAALEGYELAKDESLELELSGYNGQISMHWDNPAAIEFMLVYKDGSNIKMIGDLYDKDGVFTAAGNDPLFDTDPQNHAFAFGEDLPKGPDWIVFSLSATAGLPVGAQLRYLRITVRQDPGVAAATKIDLQAGTGFPDQVRRLIATTYDTATDVNVVSSIITQIPLRAQSIAALNYVLGSEGILQKN